MLSRRTAACRICARSRCRPGLLRKGTRRSMITPQLPPGGASLLLNTFRNLRNTTPQPHLWRLQVRGSSLPKVETESAEVFADAVAAVVDAGMADQKVVTTHAVKVALRTAVRVETADRSVFPNRVSPGRPRVRRLATRNRRELNRSDRLRDISPFCFPENPFRSTSVSRHSRLCRSRLRGNRSLNWFQRPRPRHCRCRRQPSRKMSRSLPARLRLSLCTNSTTTTPVHYPKSRSRQLLRRSTGIVNSGAPRSR